jgi:hypothetical protein
MVEMSDHVDETTSVRFDFDEPPLCTIDPRNDEFLAEGITSGLPVFRKSGEPSWPSFDLKFSSEVTGQVEIIDTKDGFTPLVHITLSSDEGSLTLHLSPRATRKLRDALAQMPLDGEI